MAIDVVAKGATKDKASEAACLLAVAHLISANPSEILLRPARWTASPEELLRQLPGADGGRRALPAHIPARLQDAGAEAATPDADARVAELLRACLRAHGGEFDPSCISHKMAGRLPGEVRAYSEFNNWLRPGCMKAFVDGHSEFSWRPRGKKGMVISWAPGQVAQEAQPSAAEVAEPGSASA